MAKFGDDIYLELLEEAPRTEVHEDKSEEKMEAGVLTSEARPKPIKEEIPVRLKHRKKRGPFHNIHKVDLDTKI